MHSSDNDTVIASEGTSLERIPGRIRWPVLLVLVALVASGVVGLVLGLGDSPQRAWQAYLVNFLFFSGLAAAGVIFGAIMQVAKGHWGVPLHRVAQGFGAFLPVSFLLFIGLWAGRTHIFPWAGEPVVTNMEGHPVPAAWFDLGGIFGRGTVFLLLLYAGCLVFMYYSLRPDMGAAAERLAGWRRRLAAWIGRDAGDPDAEAARSRGILARLSAPLVLLYVIGLSGVAVDLIMSLVPGWVSVLFPAYFFVGAWLSALAGTAVMAALHRGRLGPEALPSNHWHDLGKLIFAFCVFWAYLWFSQFLPIWYGNMPRETVFVRARWTAPWTAVSVTFFACVFLLPFVLLLGQKVKMAPRYLASVAGLILVGFWIERFEMVVPSIWEGGIPFGRVELLITAGFLGLFGLCYAAYSSMVPMIPVYDSLIVGQPREGPY